MKKFIAIIILNFAFSASLYAKSSLPDCQGEDFKKWTNCFGTWTKVLTPEDKKGMGIPDTHEMKRIYTGEFGAREGLRTGQGVSKLYIKLDGSFKKMNSYVGSFLDDLPHGFGSWIYHMGNGDYQKIHQWYKGKVVGTWVMMTFPPEPHHTYIGEFITKDGFTTRHGKGMYILNNGSKLINIWTNSKISGDISDKDLNDFEEKVLIYKANVEANQECQGGGNYKKCVNEKFKKILKEANELRLKEIEKFKNDENLMTVLFKNQKNEIRECAKLSALGACVETIAYDKRKYEKSISTYGNIDIDYFTGTYKNSKPKLYFDNRSGKMGECATTPYAGVCTSFKPYNQSNHTINTLYYNPKAGAMQRCRMEVLGNCRIFDNVVGIPTQDQLFYNPKTKSMAPCMISNHRGKCQSFGIAPVVPQSYQKPKYKNPYYFSSPTSSSGLINQGLSMIGGGCTLGISC